MNGGVVKIERATERAALVTRIEAEQRALREAVHDLRTEARERASLGYLVSRAPYDFLVAGFVVGLWMGFRR